MSVAASWSSLLSCCISLHPRPPLLPFPSPVNILQFFLHLVLVVPSLCISTPSSPLLRLTSSSPHSIPPCFVHLFCTLPPLLSYLYLFKFHSSCYCSSSFSSFSFPCVASHSPHLFPSFSSLLTPLLLSLLLLSSYTFLIPRHPSTDSLPSHTILSKLLLSTSLSLNFRPLPFSLPYLHLPHLCSSPPLCPTCNIHLLPVPPLTLTASRTLLLALTASPTLPLALLAPLTPPGPGCSSPHHSEPQKKPTKPRQCRRLPPVEEKLQWRQEFPFSPLLQLVFSFLCS